MTERPPLPDPTILTPDPATRLLDDGRVLMGGVPLAVLRLGPAGVDTVRRWFAGSPVEHTPASTGLARRLIDTGIAHPDPGPTPNGNGTTSQVVVVIPVFNDQAGLEETLACLLPRDDDNGTKSDVRTTRARVTTVVVVDDGSDCPVELDEWTDPRLIVLRNETTHGPGMARQKAMDRLSSRPDRPADELVLFIDANVTLGPNGLSRLVGALEDQDVVAVAPRVHSRPDPHPAGRYDARRSPLDLGPVRSLVGPGRMVSYLPTACLLVRRDAFDQAGGFDPALRHGEDVDLVWRLGRIGAIRYEPTIGALHPPRPDLWEMICQRATYGLSAAPLAERHGDAVAPARTSPWSALVGGLVFSGRPVAAAATSLGTAALLRRKLSFLPDAMSESVMLTTKGHWYGTLSLLTALTRTWLPPAAVAAALVPRLRRPLAAAVVAGWARRLLDGSGSPSDRLSDVAIGAVDDTAYCAGVWAGMVKARRLTAIKPVLASWPSRSGSLESSD